MFSAGIRPRDELARAAGLAVGERGGIRINSHCQTTNPDIYAIGECALWEGRIFGLVAPGYQMAEVAARHLPARRSVQFLGADMSTKLKLMGVDVALDRRRAWQRRPARSTTCSPTRRPASTRSWSSRSDRKQLLGAILVGDATDYGTLLQMALNPMPLPEHPEDLILPAREGAAKGLGVDLLPDSALICSCNSVTKGAICDADRRRLHSPWAR